MPDRENIPARNIPAQLCRRLNHIAVAVRDAAAAAAIYRDVLGASVSEPQALPQHGVTTIFVRMPGAAIELLQPLGENSPIEKFLRKNPSGGLHHLCYEVEDIHAAEKHLRACGIAPIGAIAEGAHGKPVLFLHPRDCAGVLIELEQADAPPPHLRLDGRAKR